MDGDKELRYSLTWDDEGIVCVVYDRHLEVTTYTWSKCPGKRQVYWGHGLVIPEAYRRQGISMEIHNRMWNVLPPGSLVMLSVAWDNQAAHNRMEKLDYDEIYSTEDYSVYAKVKE